jgi:hypothetical protein
VGSIKVRQNGGIDVQTWNSVGICRAAQWAAKARIYRTHDLCRPGTEVSIAGARKIPRNSQENRRLDRGLVDRGRGCDKGAITGSKGVSGLQKWPSGAPDFNKLRIPSLLSRQRSRVRAPSSPPLILNALDSNGILSDNLQNQALG